MKLTKIKDEIRAIGIDDAPFIPHTKGKTRVFGVITRGNQNIEGIEQVKIEIDGTDATEKLAEMIRTSKHYGQIRVIMLNGITFGGFNIVDIDELAKLTDLPTISVIDTNPNFDSIKIALQKHFEDWETRWDVFTRVRIEQVTIKSNSKPLFFHYSVGDLTADIIKQIFIKTSQRSNSPECIRIAHMIGASFLSKKNI
ncbi:MAG: DUF99 family protein [Candidatus Lokiarchaeota archaeon]|nr:DUF99 family protein [Candidatus Lokiarchaeota archaeon]